MEIKKKLISRSSENRQKFIFSLVFLLKMGLYICINISETRSGSLPEFFCGIYTCQWMTYQKKILKLIIRNDSRERGAYPLKVSAMDEVGFEPLTSGGTMTETSDLTHSAMMPYLLLPAVIMSGV